MDGMRHQPRRRTAHLLLCVSVLALFALACFPVLAQADSSGVQYSDAPPTATGGPTGGTGSGGGAPAHSSNSPSGGTSGATPTTGSNPSNSSTVNSDGGSGSSQEKSNATGGGTAAQGTQGQGGAGDSANARGPASQLTGAPAAETSDNGGSSPLVPILIAIAVLAALSIAAVLIRQRRQRGGSTGTVSPKAG
jgi:cobalamin biosynthesis Mg chelatase CobN